MFIQGMDGFYNECKILEILILYIYTYTFIVFVSMFVSLSLSIRPVVELLHFIQWVHGFQVYGD